MFLGVKYTANKISFHPGVKMYRVHPGVKDACKRKKISPRGEITRVNYPLKHLLRFEICAREICEKFVYKHLETIKYVSLLF